MREAKIDVKSSQICNGVIGCSEESYIAGRYDSGIFDCRLLFGKVVAAFGHTL